MKSSFSEMATKIWKNLPLASTLLSKKSCFVKTGERFFQILWPSHKVLISTNVNLIWMIWIDLFLNLEKRQKSFSLHYTKVQFLRRPKKLVHLKIVVLMLLCYSIKTFVTFSEYMSCYKIFRLLIIQFSIEIVLYCKT